MYTEHWENKHVPRLKNTCPVGQIYPKSLLALRQKSVCPGHVGTPECEVLFLSNCILKSCHRDHRPIFMPPPLGAGGIMFSGCPSVPPSVCPSVRSLKYPLSTCTWVRWSIRPTVTVLQHVRPSVRAFAGERMEGMAWNFACWCIVTTFRTDQIMVTVCSFSSFWRHFDLVKRVKFGGSGHFPGNAWRECRGLH